MKHLRNLSARPELVVDQRGKFLPEGSQGSPTSDVGIPGPFGRERIVTALRTNRTRPSQLAAPVVLHDGRFCHLGDPDGNLVGTPGVWVHRLVSAGKVADTRRL